MSNFSFTGQPILKILERIPRMVPGIRKGIGVYYDGQKRNIEAWEVNKQENLSEDKLYMLDGHQVFLPYRKEGKSISWLKKEELSFDTSREKEAQLEVFDEMERNILLLRLKNEYDSLYDLIFLYFEKSGIGIRNTGNVLSPDNRALIGYILYHAIQEIVRNSNKDLKEFERYNEVTRTIVKDNNQLEKELEQTKMNYGDSLVDLCKYHLEEITKDKYTGFQFTEKAIEKIKTFRGGIKNLYNIIEQGVRFVENLYFDTREDIIRIEPAHLNFAFLEQPTGGQDTLNIPERYFKTVLLLDKLERSAGDVIKKGKELTGANVGASCPSPISAAAITDALKKHGNRVIALLKKYPDRWNLIKSGFKPLKNVIESHADNKTYMSGRL